MAHSRCNHGGLSCVQQADGIIQKLCYHVQSQVETQTGRQFELFCAVEYASQVVAGVNLFIKVYVGQEEFLHLRIYDRVTGPISLTSFQTGKVGTDPISYF
ncbi:cystatin-B-like [Pelobates cultripes]|uniref:Cystatin-B-like n=1 Tax=Pelobates cultripes TaxID=61616 RepID=A0AAD1QWI1_PELCU|nr:cystatin-B-like [Pelobates cultripes]